MNIKLLALDTTEAACSAALLIDGQILSRFELAARSHSERILPMMQSLLTEAGLELTSLDALAFGRGPGSFTGLRIAAGVVQGTALGADLPVIPISTLRALAQGAYRQRHVDKVLSALDARMAEVYWGAFTLNKQKIMQPVIEEKVCEPAAVILPGPGDWYGVGSGWLAYQDMLSRQSGIRLEKTMPEAQIEAQDIALLAAAEFALGNVLAPEHAVPVYLRDNVAKKKSSL